MARSQFTVQLEPHTKALLVTLAEWYDLSESQIITITLSRFNSAHPRVARHSNGEMVTPLSSRLSALDIATPQWLEDARKRLENTRG